MFRGHRFLPQKAEVFLKLRAVKNYRNWLLATLKFPRPVFWETGQSRLTITNLAHELESRDHQETYQVSMSVPHTRREVEGQLLSSDSGTETACRRPVEEPHRLSTGIKTALGSPFPVQLVAPEDVFPASLELDWLIKRAFYITTTRHPYYKLRKRQTYGLKCPPKYN